MRHVIRFGVLLVAAVLASATAPGAAAPALTRDEEKRLVVEICTSAWEESADTQYYARNHLLVVLAMVAPDRADQLVAALPEGARPDLQRLVMRGLLLTDPQIAVTRIDQERADPYTLLDAARRLAPHNAALARDLLYRAVEAIEKQPADWLAAARLAEAAALARQVDDLRAPDLVEEVQRRLPEVLRRAGEDAAKRDNDAWGKVRVVAEALARADADEALKLVERIPDENERRQVQMNVVARSIAPSDPERALALVDAARSKDTPEGPELAAWCYAARRTAVALGERDLPRAAALARRIPRGRDRSETLALLAGIAGGQQAARLCREALDDAATSGPYQDSEAALRVAELTPPSLGRRRACALALELAAKPERRSDRLEAMVAHAAFILVPVAPEEARLLLEDALLNCAGSDEGARSRKAVAIAYAALDPGRAVAIARQIPVAQADARFDALRKIAQYLAVPPEVRAGIHFARWRAYDTWMPGEETDW